MGDTVIAGVIKNLIWEDFWTIFGPRLSYVYGIVFLVLIWHLGSNCISSLWKRIVTSGIYPFCSNWKEAGKRAVILCDLRDAVQDIFGAMLRR